MFTAKDVRENSEALQQLLDEHRLMKQAIQNCPAPFCVYNSDDELVVHNTAYEELYPKTFASGRNRENLTNLTYSDIIRDNLKDHVAAEDLEEAVKSRVETHRRADGTAKLRRDEITQKVIQIQKYRTGDDCVAGIAFDLTELKHREDELAAANELAKMAELRLNDALNTMPGAVVIYDRDGKIFKYNEQFKAIFDLEDLDDLVGVSFEDFLTSGVNNGLYINAMGREDEWVENRVKGHGQQNEPWIEPLSGNRYLRVHERRSQNGDFVNCYEDVTETTLSRMKLEEQTLALAVLNDEVEEQALHDPLTGLPNRRYLDRKIKTLDAVLEDKSTSVALLHVDLDHFKEVNDSIGHEAGDHVLCITSNVIQSTLRDSDFAARVGGDEFVVLLTPAPSIDMAAKVGQRIVQALKEPIDFNGHTCKIGASIGIATSDQIDGNFSDLIRCADLAMYRAKELGRGQVKQFTADLQREMLEFKQMSEQLQKAIEAREFFPIYQPQFATGTRTLCGVEVLCRWDNPDRGLLGPSDFIPIAESMGVIDEIDRIVFQRVSEDLLTLQKNGVRLPRVSFNASLDRIHASSFISDVQMILDAGIAVSIELLETHALDNPTEETTAVLARLNEIGARVEIDEFGSCSASIVGLIAASPRAMKIDSQIIEPITRSEPHRQLVRAIIGIGLALDIEVVAGGVETPEHISLLERLGCDEIQGYALAKPMPISELRDFLSLLKVDRMQRQIA